MTYIGTVRNGLVELPPDARLEEGTVVHVTPLEVAEPDPADNLSGLAIETGIRDLASQHDHYAWGTPKRES